MVYTPLWAMLCDLLLELSVWVGMSGPPWYDVFTNGFGFLLGSLVLWFVLVAFICATNRLWLSLGLLLALTVVVAAANRAKLGIRQEPLYPSDLDFLSSPRFLITMTDPWRLLAGVLVVAAIVGGAVATGRRADRLFRRVRRSEAPSWWWSLLAARLLVGVLCVQVLMSATGFNEPDNSWRAVYDAKNVQWRSWYQRLNYHDNGFVGGFLYNMPAQAMTRPADYDETTMTSIAHRYAALAEARNAGRSEAALADVNVVLVLSEAFSDPTQLEGFELERDPIPRTRETMASTVAGTMLAQLYGGGTANVEFEALTGQSLALFEPQMNTPYQMLVPDYDEYPSAVEWFARFGHRPVAIHPYFPGMYMRDRVYRTLGFDEFIHDTTMQHTDHIDGNRFISDQSAFDEVRHQIDASRKPLFANLVTMQNHVPVSDSYKDPIAVEGVTDKQAGPIGQYARGIEHSDQALQQFLGDLQSSDEETVVVFFGDHQPGIYGDEITQANPDVAMHRTPFFIWSTQGNQARALPVTSPIHFLPLLFDAVGQKLPPYFVLLEELRAEIPAMEQGRFFSDTGHELSETQLSPRARQLLDDLRLVQYDLSVGERYVADELWAVPD